MGWLLGMVFVPLARANTVEVRRPEMRHVVREDAKLTVVASGLTWAEGPLPLDDGRLLFADVKSNSIRAVDARAHVKILKQPSGYAGATPYAGPEPGSSGMKRDARGRVVVAGHAGRAIFRYDGVPGPGVARRTLVERYEGKRLNSPNDLALAKDGSIYFTDPAFGLPTQEMADPAQELTFAGVYRLKNPGEPNQKLELLSRDLKTPNGLALSPDEKTLYVANSKSKTWVKFAVRADGTLDGPHPFASAADEDGTGEPDGLTVDDAGHVYAAGPGGVWVIDARGQKLGRIRVPKFTSNVALGGQKRRTLYITAHDTIYKIDLMP